ncbi:MAG: ribulokinase [Planctomycetaceae bacterium]|jgi:L-ribulokinase|nr:ribulokinase [Planctomycetaceae bacterium]
MTKSKRKFAIGLDFGTNSVRALIVDIENGQEIASVVDSYPSGDAGVLLDSKQPLLARQNPEDYINGFYRSVSGVVRQALHGKDAEFSPEDVVGIGVDTTGSTPIPVDRHGMALGLLPQFKNEPDAQSWLWKDHTSFAEAAEITEKASRYQVKYLSQCGEKYSSEWFWSKILHCKRVNPKVFEAAYSWVELTDFIPALMIGNTDPDTLPRGICAAGHKAMFHTQWDGLPSAEFLCSLDLDLVRLRDHFNFKTKTADQSAGQLCESVAVKVGLVPGIAVAVGAIDCHAGAVGAGIKPGTLVKIMGTSTCDVMIHPLSEPLATIPGLCGIVPGSVMSGMYGIEAGQSGVGDIFNWFVKNMTPESFTQTANTHDALSVEAQKLLPGESGLLALDWHSGNRSVLVDQLLTGLILGMTVHTTSPEIYRTLIEATAFGALTIINRFEEYGIKVDEVINCGGIAEKSPLTMQIYADVCNKPMKISRSAQTCALGAAILGAVAGGYYNNVETAQQKMTGVKEKVYIPDSRAVAVYQRLYQLYHDLHNAFGCRENPHGLHHVMKELIDIRDNMRK